MQFIIILFLFFSILHAETNTSIVLDDNQADVASSSADVIRLQSSLLLNLTSIDKYLNDSNNAWSKRYMNYKTYLDITHALETAEKTLYELHDSDIQAERKRAMLERQIETLKKQKELLSEYKDNPYSELMSPSVDERTFHISNPILIIQGVGYIQQLRQEDKRLVANYQALELLLTNLREKARILNEIKKIDNHESILGTGRDINKEIVANQNMLEYLSATRNVFTTTLDIYQRKMEEDIQKVTNEITDQVIKGVIVALVVVLSVLIAFMMKLGIRRYITDNDRSYTMSKIVNYINIIIIVLIVLFAYLENVTYLVAFLGFASAGLAIAMKDLFMSVLGWIVIVMGGSVHVGDRIRVTKDGATYIGDVLDISLLRITIHEGITLLTYTDHRRAGRIIFIPNNYIFTTMIANYTHGSMKTVWDGIDVTITFDSNYKKMAQICLDIAKHYAKGYTDITRKQLNLLRDRYSLRNTNVEPKVFTMLVPNGIRISLWYQTNAYAALPLHSTIVGEILDSIRNEDDIVIAYPTTTVRSGGNPLTDGSIPQNPNAQGAL